MKDTIRFKEDHLRRALVELDTDRDGQISYNEAEIVVSMNVGQNNFEWYSGWELESLSGIVACIKLEELDLSSNELIESLDISDMPSLEKVCVWVLPLPHEGVGVYMEGSPNVYLTTACR